MALAGRAIAAKRLHLTVPQIDQRLLVCSGFLGCILLSFTIYWPFMRDGFVSDDFAVLLAVRDHPWHQVLLRAFTFPEATSTQAATGSWRPLADLTFWAMLPSGLNPVPYHVTNFFVHGLVGGLATVLLWRLSGRAAAAVISGFVFVAAPTYDFLVTWNVEIVELIEVAAILGALLALHSYLVAAQRRPAFVFVAVVSCLIAVLAKETSLLLLVLLPGLLVHVRLTGALKRSRDEVLAGFALPLGVVVAYGVMLAVLQLGQDEPATQLNAGSPQRFWDYLRWIVFPYRFGEFMLLRTLATSALLTLGIALALMRRYLLTALLGWTLVALLPFLTIGIVELRYTYFAALPFVAFAVFGVDTLLRLLPLGIRPVAQFAAAAVAVIVVAGGAAQVRDQQFYVTSQAAAYDQMIVDVRALCGEMAAGQHVFVVGGPVFDPYGLNVPAALNLYYDDVHAAALPELPPLAAFIEDKCVIQYDAATGTYARRVGRVVGPDVSVWLGVG